jgi:uncharacterized membrane protein
MLTAIFNTMPQALKGVVALRDLDRAGEIKLYTTAVITKDASGTISIKQAAERQWKYMVYGLLIGILLGTFGGPFGLAIGGLIGGLAGSILDLAKTAVSADLLAEASRSLAPGKTALLAELDETWEAPVDQKLMKLGGRVYRQARSEFLEDQMMDELDRIDADLNSP